MKKRLVTVILAIVAVLLPKSIWAQTAYAVLTDNETVISESEAGITYGKTLTFYYDGNMADSDYPVTAFQSADERGWTNDAPSISVVAFDASFANYSPTNTAYWFSGMTALQTLDLSRLNMASVTNADGMFTSCIRLTTITVNTTWPVLETTFGATGETANITGTDMFNGCRSLVGGAGTQYNPEYVDYTYAHIDGGADNPGYFTAANAAGNEALEIYTIDASTTYSSNEPLTPTPSIVMTPGNDTAWNTYEVFGFNNVQGIDFSASIYYPSRTETQTISACIAGTSNPVDDAGSAYVAQDKNVPTTGGYYIFEPNQDGSLIIPVSIGATKQLYVTDGSGNVNTDIQVKDANGQTLKMLTSPLCAFSETDVTNGFISMNVQQGQKYYVFCTGSKMICGGYVFSTEAIEIDPTTMADVKNALADRGEAVPYAVVSDNYTKLTFYYDDQKDARGGSTIVPYASKEERPWDTPSSEITTVVFDASFANCTTLTSTAYWFETFGVLTAIEGLEYLNTANVTDMKFMFEECQQLPSIDLSHFNTSKVTDMRLMFGACKGLSSLDLSSFNTTNVTDMSEMFHGCQNLTNLDLSSFNTANVTSMSFMFNGCSGLTSIDISSFNTTNVSEMNDMFRGCSNLTSLNLTNFNSSNVTNMARMFWGSSKLETVTVGEGWVVNSSAEGTGNDGVAGDATDIGENMFYNCYHLKGGKGTTYDANHTGSEYARIDNAPDAPGYFTDANATADDEPTFDSNGVLTVNGSMTMEEVLKRYDNPQTITVNTTALMWNSSAALTENDLANFTNPNMLIYVNDGNSQLPANRTNVVVNGTARKVVLTDVNEGNGNYYCPQE